MPQSVPACHNCGKPHPVFQDHCLLELLGVALMERGHSDEVVRAMLRSLCPVEVWETVISQIVQPLEAAFSTTPTLS